jgi:DNA-binding transcriptional MerR regulator
MLHRSVNPATAIAEGELTIDELARRTGMTVRNIRAHQSRGLLPAPEVRGRTGYYGDEHVARLELIRELQADGFNLSSIKRVIGDVGKSSSAVLDFTRAVRTPFEQEQPEIVDVAEWAERWQGTGFADPAATMRRAADLGLIRLLGDGRIEILSPALARAGAELAALGVTPDTALEVLESLRRSARGVSRTFVNLFLTEVWEPFDRAGRPEQDWPKVREALDRLRPLASEALLAAFQPVMTEAVEKAFERALKQEAGGDRRSRRRSRRR